MNIELKPRPDSFSVPAPALANDNTKHWRESGSPRRRAVIYKPAKSAMTSGRAGSKRWLLEYEAQSAPFIEPLMGWTGTADPMARMRLTFPSLQAAIAYARRQGLDYVVHAAAEPVKAPGAGDKPQSQPMPLWHIESPRSERNPPLSDVSAGGFASSLAA